MSGVILMLVLAQAALAGAIFATSRRPEPKRVRIDDAERDARR